MLSTLFPVLKRSVLVSLAISFCLCSCATTFNAVDPRPNVSVDGASGSFALDVSKLSDEHHPGRGIHILQFRKTMENAFRNAVGDKFSASNAEATKLVFEETNFEIGHVQLIGAYYSFLQIRFKAAWIDPSGNKIATSSGIAKPNNITDTGPRHLEDVVEVMFQQVIDALEKGQGTKVR